ncbi:MAG: diguanylate cyclase [Acidobacteria bacterium]|nr:diguanylate cyclase [Acidobacteriota bacterium]
MASSPRPKRRYRTVVTGRWRTGGTDAVAGPESAHPIESQEIKASCRIGVAVFPGDATARDALLRGADDALYHAKQRAERIGGSPVDRRPRA